jgi:hypothetical protein
MDGVWIAADILLRTATYGSCSWCGNRNIRIWTMTDRFVAWLRDQEWPLDAKPAVVRNPRDPNGAAFALPDRVGITPLVGDAGPGWRSAAWLRFFDRLSTC